MNRSKAATVKDFGQLLSDVERLENRVSAQDQELVKFKNKTSTMKAELFKTEKKLEAAQNRLERAVNVAEKVLASHQRGGSSSNLTPQTRRLVERLVEDLAENPHQDAIAPPENSNGHNMTPIDT